MGPAVSWVAEIGMMPARLHSPTVGLMPTTPLHDEGETMEPSVSVPMARAHRLADTAAPDPADEPLGVRSRIKGFLVWPPRLLQPLVLREERKLAHSLRLVLPSRTAPAARSFCTMNASCAARCPLSASEPAVVCSWSPVSMLSLMSTGTPCSGPRTLPFLRSWSSWSAMRRASGFSSMTLRNVGPLLSMASMRCRYSSVSWRAVRWPLLSCCCKSARVASCSSKASAAAAEVGAAPGVVAPAVSAVSAVAFSPGTSVGDEQAARENVESVRPAREPRRKKILRLITDFAD